MDKQFFAQLFKKQQSKETVPSNEKIASWAMELIWLLYPEISNSSFTSIEDMEAEFELLKSELLRILHSTKACLECNNEDVTNQFFKQVPEILRLLNTDIEAILLGDPAAHNQFEIIRAYPGFYALSFYRIAHALYRLEV